MKREKQNAAEHHTMRGHFHSQIRLRLHQLLEADNCRCGSSFRYWLEAERELLALAKVPARQTRNHRH